MQRLRTRLRAGATAFPPATFALNFLTGALDSGVTFSRGSNATLVDSTGKITYAPANLLLYSQGFDDANWTKLNGTTTAANTTVAPDGTTTADTIIEAATTNIFGVRQSASLPAGSTAFSVYVKPNGRNWVQLNCAAGGSGSAFFNISTGAVGTTSGATASISAAANGFYRCTIVVTATAGANTFDLRLASADGVLTYAGNGTSGVFAWGAQLEQVTYQTTPSTYVATTSAAYYGPRFDYDPVTLAAKGLLIEEQRTNLVTYSEQFDNAAWAKTRATISANATASPDGTTNADKLVEDTTATSSHFTNRIISASASTAYTQSIFIKSAERTRGQLQIFGNSGGSTVSFDLTAGTADATGAYGGWASASATITNFGNGWYRITNTATTNVGLTAINWGVYLADASGSGSYTGNGTSGFFIWGAQLEAGAFATSYIPTVASTVTRSADVATMTGTNFSSWYNQSEGTFVINFTPDEGLTNNVTRVLAVSQGGVTARVVDLYTNGTNWVNYNGTTATAFGTATVTTTPQNIAIAYKTADYAYVQNAGTVAAVASALVNAPTQMAIGHIGSAQQLNGHIRQIAYYNTRLPNATLQALTA